MNQEEITQQLQAAVALHNQGELDQAEAIYMQILAVDANNFYALNFCGCILRSKERYEESCSFLKRAVCVKPGDIGAQYNLGNVLRDLGDFGNALIHYKAALKIDCLDANVLFEFANACRALGDTDGAIVSYRKAIDMKPDFVDASLNLGNVLKEQAEVEEATAIYRKALELNSDHEGLYFELAFSLIRQGRVFEALEVLRNGLRKCKTSPDLKHLIGTLLISQGQEEEGRLFVAEAFSIDPSFGRKVDGFSLRSDTAEEFWRSLHSTEEAHLGYWKQNPLRKKLASVICSIDGVTSVLECGCNVGGNLFAINSINDQISLKGVDMNPDPIEFGRQKFIELGIDVDMSVMRLQDLANIESDSVDVAYTSAVLQHIPPEYIPDILANMIRISRKYVVFWELHGFSPADALLWSIVILLTHPQILMGVGFMIIGIFWSVLVSKES